MKFNKNIFLFAGITFLSLNLSCSNSKNMNAAQSQNFIEFTEERKLNHSLNLKETTIINSAQELTELYSKLRDKSIPRSAPIPAFDENTESIIILKPTLKNLTYADIEIESIEKVKSKLRINYREIENWEFTENKWNNPIVILRISEKPSEIQLNRIN
ncbi:hypothetical protein [Moheibacter sediminis]|uniref:Uncharacterized protein n=1 Tax=Moheibacter sediminis TaxID=1434700 RepID=A0A1W1Z2H3_9FLAO|nr:hypothetical protein [Moheibacter sediminis]SMC42583.1 hypothetical protein SAMN06296427_102132 [Moheibacter sediminis]